MPILISLRYEFGKAMINDPTLLGIDLRAKLGTPDSQPESVLDEAPKPLREAPPFWGLVKDTGTDQVPQEMKDTALFEERRDFVVGTEEITDQDAFERFPQHLLEDRGGPGGGDKVISEFYLLAGEAPEPIGLAQHPPSGLVYMEQGAGFGQHSQVFIPG